MFEATRLVLYYAVSPVHMGAGSAIGAIDSPIQREVHTQHPMFAGSGLKGALRHHFNRIWRGERGRNNAGMVNRIFGPETNASDFAGALSLSDAQLVALPVRSLKGGFVYATSPLALARARRLAQLAGVESAWTVPEVAENEVRVSQAARLSDKRLILETFEFVAHQSSSEVGPIASWLASAVFGGDSSDFFADKLRKDLVILSDTDFSHFARHAMVVEPHVRINDETGTADGGGLFYVENLPPESIMIGLVHASIERYRAGDRDKVADRMDDAAQVLDVVLNGSGNLQGIAGKPLQIGGDASTGRGLVLIQASGPRSGS